MAAQGQGDPKGNQSGDESPQSKADALRRRVHERIDRLPVEMVGRVDEYASLLEHGAQTGWSLAPLPANLKEVKSTNSVPISPAQTKDWPHAPIHRLSEHGTYMVTAGTLHKLPIFSQSRRLDLLQDTLLKLAKEFGWNLEAWAVFPNHYHFVAHATPAAAKLDGLLTQLHADTARDVNEWDDAGGRQVWFNFWDTQLTFEKSYQARLCYVHFNAVKHGLVRQPNQYRWCSAAWFERTARPAQVKTIYSFKTDKLKVFDDFEVSPETVG